MTPTPVHTVDATTPCERLRTSYPSAHGLIVFPEPGVTRRAIAWCNARVEGRGVQGYALNVAIERAGLVHLTVSDARPATRFRLLVTPVHCEGDSTGKSIHNLGAGTDWTMDVVPGDYCFNLFKDENQDQDVWFTLTVTRPQ